MSAVYHGCQCGKWRLMMGECMQNGWDRQGEIVLNNVVSFSGGKDSTAMLLMMLERGDPIHSVIFFDTGWEFPAMEKHVSKVEMYTGVKIVRLKPGKSFNYWMFDHKIIKRSGSNKGEVHAIGNGWPSSTRRWCTREKVRAIDEYLKNVEDPISCVGMAADEQHRVRTDTKTPCRYPLIEMDIDENKALEYCLERGFNWDGLYGVFNRVSCFCCPLQRIGELKKLRANYPELWLKMLEWDRKTPDHNMGFKGYKSVHDLELRFAEEDRFLKLPM